MKYMLKQDRWYKRAWLPVLGLAVWASAPHLFPWSIGFPIMVAAMTGMVGGGLVYMVLGSPYDNLDVNVGKGVDTK